MANLQGINKLGPNQPLESNLNALATNPKAAIDAFGIEWAGAVAASAMERLAQPEQTVSVDEYKRLQKLVTNQGIRLMEYESEQPEQEPVANGLPLVIAGAIFDFAGYLTTRDTVIEVGSTANASPVADLVKDWATLRGLSLADAAVLSWQEWLTDVRANDTSKERVDEMQKQRHDTTPPQPASKPWVGLTEEEIDPITQAQWGWNAHGLHDAYRAYVRAIEAKLKEKNENRN